MVIGINMVAIENFQQVDNKSAVKTIEIMKTQLFCAILLALALTVNCKVRLRVFYLFLKTVVTLIIRSD